MHIKLLLLIIFLSSTNSYTKTFTTSSRTIKASSFGFNPKNSTSALKAALYSDYDTIVVDKQQTAWIVNPIIINNLKNKTIFFESGVILEANKKSFNRIGDQLFKIVDSENITLIGYETIFKMHKSLYSKGEWRHALSILGSRNIRIYGITFKNSGGDGIYISGSKTKQYSENIYINDICSSNNYRQGMSIISVQNLFVKNAIFSETKGTLPGAGIDIEPNHKEQRIVNVNFKDCKFVNNNHAGVLLALTKLRSTSLPISVRFTDCYFKNNHHPENDYKACEVGIKANSIDPVVGYVVFDECLFDGSKWGIINSNKSSKAYIVTFKNCAAFNISTNKTHAPIELFAPNRYGTYGPIGGFNFDNLMIQYRSKLPFLKIRSTFLGKLNSLDNVKGFITVFNENSSGIEYINYNPKRNLDVYINYNKIMDELN